MNTPRGSIFLIGLILCLLVIGGTYFLLQPPQPAIVAIDSPTVAAKSSVMTPSDASPQTQVPTSSAPTYQYNAQGQLQTIHYPDGSVYSYTYDSHGDKIRETTRTGKTWTYAYDAQQHPIAVIDPEGHITH